MLVGSITPGPNNALLMRSGLNFGVWRSLRHWCGIVCGFSFMLLVLSLLLPLVPDQAQDWLYWLALAFGLYIAYKIASTPVAPSEPSDEHKILVPWGFWQAAAFQWINPKAWMLGLTIFGAFALPELTTIVVATLCNISCGSWLVAGKLLQRLVAGNPRRSRIIYLLLGLSMAGSLLL